MYIAYYKTKQLYLFVIQVGTQPMLLNKQNNITTKSYLFFSNLINILTYLNTFINYKYINTYRHIHCTYTTQVQFTQYNN